MVSKIFLILLWLKKRTSRAPGTKRRGRVVNAENGSIGVAHPEVNYPHRSTPVLLPSKGFAFSGDRKPVVSDDR
jgi:hypothetical protein